MHDLVRRIDAATPADRDRAIDALRALAITGVVLGHWLVTALVIDSGTVHSASPLGYLPELTPISWVFQTLAVFFLVGGLVGAQSYASARAKGTGYRRWLGARMARLFRPVAALLSVWSVAVVVMLAAGVDQDTLHTLCKLMLSPLWFLLVFAVLTAITPLVTRMHPLWPFAVVLLVDVIRFVLDGPGWLNSLNVVVGWLVPYSVGAAWARGGLRSLRARWAMLLGGAAACTALVLFAGYPAAMVGVPGPAISNLDPPNLATVTFGTAQCGAALLLLGPLRRVLARPVAWAAVALVNLSAMTIFLWHQTSMMAVTALGLLVGEPLPGLHTVPDHPGWILARLAWLPVFAGVLLICWTTFRTYEQARPRRTSRVVRGAWPALAGPVRRLH
ncbi:acyltransferase [Streptomyces sp. NBC_00536]|uniref:acyltransferase family protein n=1 Tax=Streptomyces sp. NBC_00536 TaxID=2975769 RepID=UPI002E812820|nr:acyltransferase [Streptomyces sp. NBC_00536]WUC81854.1 acyltransferase [Streptomyces sp. NBC_00536]